jgi:hypothetical protein
LSLYKNKIKFGHLKIIGISLTKWVIWAWAHFQFWANRSILSVKEAHLIVFQTSLQTLQRQLQHIFSFSFFSSSHLTPDFTATA